MDGSEGQHGQAHIRIRIGAIEIEYDGAADFLGDGLDKLLRTMADLVPISTTPPDALDAEALAQEEEVQAQSSGGKIKASTNTIAAHLETKSGSELAIAAMAYAELVLGQHSSTRQEIHKHMQAATTYYNKNLGSNLTKSLAHLIKTKRINDIGGNKYSLSSIEKKSLEAKLANIA